MCTFSSVPGNVPTLLLFFTPLVPLTTDVFALKLYDNDDNVSSTPRGMLQAGGGGSGGGASPAAGGSGGDVARSLAGQVKALRSRVEELLERARDAEVIVVDGWGSDVNAAVLVSKILASMEHSAFFRF